MTFVVFVMFACLLVCSVILGANTTNKQTSDKQGSNLAEVCGFRCLTFATNTEQTKQTRRPMNTEALRTAVQRYQSASPVMRRPMRDSAEQLGLSLAKERNEATRILDKRWAWCDANEEHPQFAEREEALIGLLHEYEAMEDALRDAATALYGEVA